MRKFRYTENGMASGCLRDYDTGRPLRQDEIDDRDILVRIDDVLGLLDHMEPWRLNILEDLQHRLMEKACDDAIASRVLYMLRNATPGIGELSAIMSLLEHIQSLKTQMVAMAMNATMLSSIPADVQAKLR